MGNLLQKSEDYSECISTNDGVWARPCFIPEVVEIINDSLKSQHLFKRDMLENYLTAYKNYLFDDTLNNLDGIKNFPSATYVLGTVQAFDYFYLKYSYKKLRWLEGEFAYHRISARTYGFEGESFLNIEDLKHGDFLILSIPFSPICKNLEFLEDLLSHCDNFDIPVLIDFAYISISKGIKINLDHDCIKTIAFSLSKVYFGMERMRTGIRLNREYEDDPIDFSNEFRQFNYAGANAAIKLFEKFPPSKVFEKLDKYADIVCKEKGYQRNNTCIFASLNSGHPEYEKYKRGSSEYARKCISEDIYNLQKLSI